MNPKQGKEEAENFMASLSIPCMDLKKIIPTFNNTSWLYGMTPGLVKCDVPPSGAGMLRLSVMGDSHFVMVRASAFLAAASKVESVPIEKITYDAARNFLQSLTVKSLAAYRAADCRVWFASVGADGLLWIPPGFLVAERVLQKPLNYGVRKSYFVDGVESKADLQALIQIRATSYGKESDRMKAVLPLFSP